MIKIKMINIETKKKITISLQEFIEQMNLSSDLRQFNDDTFKFEIVEEKKPDAEKLEKLQKKYKILAEKHRKDKQAEYPRKKQELQKIARLKEIIYTLIDRAYEYIPDEDIAEVENILENVIKNV